MEPDYPRKVYVETARKRLHELGFEVLTTKKAFLYGHERNDIISCRNEFIRKMIKICILHFTNAPTDEAVENFPEDIDPPTEERRSKTVGFFP